jgi:hypothetical protein
LKAALVGSTEAGVWVGSAIQVEHVGFQVRNKGSYYTASGASSKWIFGKGSTPQEAVLACFNKPPSNLKILSLEVQQGVTDSGARKELGGLSVLNLSVRVKMDSAGTPLPEEEKVLEMQANVKTEEEFRIYANLNSAPGIFILYDSLFKNPARWLAGSDNAATLRDLLKRIRGSIKKVKAEDWEFFPAL